MSVAAVILDTYASQEMARHALERAISLPCVSAVYTFSEQPILAGEQFHRIRPIRSLRHYSDLVINVLPHVVREDFALLVQWDGLPHAPQNWDDAFLDFDYLGAPWPDQPDSHAVGNGGFSLRSRAFLEQAAQLPLPREMPQEGFEAEDVVLCRFYRSLMECQGIRYAPVGLAQRFSYETGSPRATLGFHGVHNLPNFLPEELLCRCTDEILLRAGRRPVILANLLLAALARECHQFYDAVTRQIATDGDLHQDIAALFVKAGRRMPWYTQ